MTQGPSIAVINRREITRALSVITFIIWSFVPESVNPDTMQAVSLCGKLAHTDDAPTSSS